jgi:hypothetical protein
MTALTVLASLVKDGKDDMMTLTMKRRIITILLGFCFIGIAARADQDVIIQPEKNDLKESYLHEMAAQFFSEKCGIDMALMKNAHMLIRLWQPDRISKDEKENWPQWQIIVPSGRGTVWSATGIPEHNR